MSRDRRTGWRRVGFRDLLGRAGSRDVSDQLGGTRMGKPPLRDSRYVTQQRVARALHVRRRLAQQPPLLHELGAPGLSLVADRSQLLLAATPRLAGDHLGPTRTTTASR